jgi:Fe-S cluster assembly protein SufB
MSKEGIEEKNKYVRQVAEQKYEFGFTTDVHTDIIEKGLNEDVVRLISQKKGEPQWLLDFRLKAFSYWREQQEPKWGHVHVPPIDYQAISYYAAPQTRKQPLAEGVNAPGAEKPQQGNSSLPAQGEAGSRAALEASIDPKLMETFDKLGIPLEERLALSGNTAVDAIMDSVSVKTTFKEQLRQKGVIFCSIGEAVKEHGDLVRQYLGTVVPYKDNFFAALNSAVFSDGSFVYIPKGVRCPMELSSYFRINARNTGQFERTLIVADDDSYVSYLEGCTAPMRDENQLHAAIVEIIVMNRAEVKYSTVQNWYPGDEQGRGGVLNLVTKRGDLRGAGSKLSWTQVETGSAITWKYPSCILRGDDSSAEFYSVAVTNNYQEADTGTKMIHLGRNTKSTIISKGISAGHSQNSYRGLVRAAATAENARNYSSCDSLLLGSNCGAHTFPYMDVHNPTAIFEHEATTSKISEDQLFYCNQRGIPTEQAVSLIVGGYAREVLQKLPMEFAVEAQKLLSVSLEGTVG